MVNSWKPLYSINIKKCGNKKKKNIGQKKTKQNKYRGS